MKRIAVVASGRGSNFQAIIDAIIDVTVEGVGKYFLLFSTYTTEVRGKAIKYDASAPALAPVPAPVQPQ